VVWSDLRRFSTEIGVVDQFAFASRRAAERGAVLPIYLAPKKLKPFISKELTVALGSN